jgi:hypothetical protein
MFLASLIKWAINNNGIVIAYVYGPMGYGKTSYALWTAYEVLGDWDKVLDHMFFELDEALDFMYRHIIRGKRIPVMILDDAGFFLNRLTWWEKPKVEFMELFNLARSIAAGIIFTSPTEEIPRQLLSKTNFRISVRPLTEEEMQSGNALEVSKIAKEFGLEPFVAVAKGYRLNVLPSFMKIVQKEYIDYYPLYYPVFEEYNRIRMRYIKKKVAKLMKKRQEDREKLLEEATEIYMKAGPREVLKFLVESGLPRSTALRWVRERIPKLLKLRGGVGEGSPTSTS